MNFTFLKGQFFLLILLCVVHCTSKKSLSEKRVDIQQINGKHTVFIEGKEFEIRGVSGYDYIEEAKEAGATVIRTWHEENAGAILDSAHKHGMYVVLTIYIPEPRNGFDFSSKEFIKQQEERISGIVNKHKDHPALLFWAVGNEVEHDPTSITVWRQLNDFIKLVKTIDDQHPVTTMINPARMSIRFAKVFLRDLDILSINAFGELGEIREKLEMSVVGWDGPAMITEWGTNGPWEELESTEWGAPIEKNSTTKAEMIRDRYNEVFSQLAGNSYMGSFIFYWGHRLEYTDTWFSIFSKHGDKTATYYEIKNLWNKTPAHNLPPKVGGIFINNKSAYDNIILKSNADCDAYVDVEMADSLKFSWRIAMEYIQTLGPDSLNLPNPEMEQVEFTLSENKVSFTADLENGPYRLFVDIYDNHGNYAYANIPFYVLE